MQDSSFEQFTDAKSLIQHNLKQAQQVLEEWLSDEKLISSIADAANLMRKSIEAGHKIISCGNGGSMCDAMHFAEELSGRFRNDRKPLAAISISDPSHITCVGNDYGFDYVFSRYLEGLGNEGDILLAISTSGNSRNVILAAETAKSKGLKVVGLTGKGGGKLAELCDVEIRAPYTDFADRAQELHIKAIHTLIQLIER
ncbi:MAG: D-sedoheptulose 7-phosphate isomerase [Flavobacteriales bacterium]